MYFFILKVLDLIENFFYKICISYQGIIIIRIFHYRKIVIFILEIF